jgi:hypothetical protein
LQEVLLVVRRAIKRVKRKEVNINKIVFILWITLGLLFFPSYSYAQSSEPCYAWIGKKDYTNINNLPYPRVTFNIQNNGVDDANKIIVKSTQFAQVDTLCPFGYVKDVTNPNNLSCTQTSGVFAPNQYWNIIEAYSGESYYTGQITSPAYGSNSVGDPYDYWTNGVNLGAIDAQYADINLAYPFTQWHNHETTSGYNITGIPDNATITGIDVEVRGYATGDFTAHNIGIYLSRDKMATYQANGSNNDLLWITVPSSPTTHTFSTSTSPQFTNYHWTPADFNNNSNFSVSLYADENNQHHFYVDYIKVMVKYEVFVGSQFEIGLNNGTTTQWCVESAMGTLYPDFSFGNGGSSSSYFKAGSLIVPLTCSDSDWFCKLKAWLYTLAIEIFAPDVSQVNEIFDTFLNSTQNKMPFYLINRVKDEIDWNPAIEATYSAIPDFDFQFTPVWIKGGVGQTMQPVSIHVDKSQFAPINPFITQVKQYWRYLLSVLFLFYVIGLIRRII